MLNALTSKSELTTQMSIVYVLNTSGFDFPLPIERVKSPNKI